MRANLFFWRPVQAGLLSFTEVENISFIDLVHAHEVLDLKDENKQDLFSQIGEILGR